MYHMFELLAKEKPGLYERLSQEQYVPFFRNMQNMCGGSCFDKTAEMTPSEMSLCYHVYMHAQKNDGAAPTVAETANALNVSVPAISRALKNLEAKEYLKRTPNPTDRRIIHISLTSNGEDVLLKNFRTIAGVMDKVLSKFSDEELEIMLRLHTKFTTTVSQVIGEIKQN